MDHAIVVSPRASERLRAAVSFLERLPAGSEAMVLAANRGAGDDFVRTLARGRGALFGIHRMTLNRLGGFLASDFLLEAGLAPAAGLAVEAVIARVVHRIRGTGALTYFEPVIDRPGFAGALARTIGELRVARVAPGALPTLIGASMGPRSIKRGNRGSAGADRHRAGRFNGAALDRARK